MLGSNLWRENVAQQPPRREARLLLSQGRHTRNRHKSRGGEDAHGSRAIVCSTLSSDTPILVLASSLQSQPALQSPTRLAH